MKKSFLYLCLLGMLVSCSVHDSTSSNKDDSSSNTNSVSSSDNSSLSSIINSSSNDESSLSSVINSSSSDESSLSSVISSSSSSSSLSLSSSSSSSSSSFSSSSISSGTTNITDLYKAEYKNNTPKDYYESCRGLKGASLKQKLHEIIKGHKTFGYSSTQSFYKTIDQDPYDSSKMYFIYTGLTSISTSYNKEHVWAKSHGSFGTGAPAGSDLHNLHPCNSNLNSTRGNLDFKEGGSVISGYTGNNKKTSSSFEPSDFSKGDVARTIFYMATRYEGESGEPDLELPTPSNKNYYDFSSGATGTHGYFDDLYKWATSGQDPVDDYEVHRNNVIYSSYQNNRNPFIDHPEFIQMIYDKNYQGPGALLDNNPFDETTWGNVSPEQEAERFVSLVESIGEINENSGDKILEAENCYQSLSEEAKALVEAEYQLLINYREQYEEYCDNILVSRAIALIDEIGEVTLDSKQKIEQAEAIVNKLNEEQLKKVTNYQLLVDARNKYDQLYEEYLKEHGQDKFEGDFKTSSGGSASYGKATIKIGDKEFLFSSCYHNKDDFRLGHNKNSSVESKFADAIPSLSGDSSSMEMNFEINNMRSIALTFDGSYGTINNIYLLYSSDKGNTFSLVSTLDYSSTDKEFKTSISDKNQGRYAFVIDGSKPRLILDKIIIE